MISGVYRGKDLFVQNPYTNVEGSFCIEYIAVNDVHVIDQPSTSAVRIDLSDYALEDSIKVFIKHHSICKPRVLNSEVLVGGNQFSFIQIMADDAAISWITTGEIPGFGYYIVEKLKLDGWFPVDTIKAKGNLDNNQYSVGVDHYAGENRFKLHYYNGDRVLSSDEFEFYSSLEPITYFPEDNIYELINLSRPTDYVIKNYLGQVLMQGYGQDIVVFGLPYGELTLVIENREETIFRPEPEIIDRPKKKPKKTGRY